MKRTAFVLSGVLGCSFVHAQEVPRYTFNAGAGFTEPVRYTGQYTDLGWNAQFAGGVNIASHFSALLDVNYNSLGINSTTLAGLGTPGGNVNIWSFTIDPVIHLRHHGPFDAYLVGGGGLYRREDQLTTPEGGFAPVFTPFGFFNAPYVGNVVVSSYSVNRPGFNAGMGVDIGTKWHAKFYAEARYNKMFTSNGDTDFVPVTFGVRW